MNPHFERARLLFEQGRYSQAAEELRQVLSTDPDDGPAHTLLALCLVEVEQFAEATQEAEQGVHLAPDAAFAHYALARVLSDRNLDKQALVEIGEAIRLDPSDADYRAMQAGLHFSGSRWQEALEMAELGLSFDPEHVGCTNLRAMALVKLGRRVEAGQSIDTALSKHPESAITHANQGWTLLEAGQREKALEHFREALRLEPENDWAQAGIVEALKAKNLIYAMMLKYFLWMGRMSPRVQWGIVLGGWFGIRALGSAARENPELRPWVLPVQILYCLFVFLSWTADPLFNLLLRLNKYGRLVLNREQVVASNWVGGCLGLALLCFAAAFFGGTVSSGLFLAALTFALLVLPLSGVFRCQPGWPRTTMAAATILLALVGGAGLTRLLIVLQQDAGNTERAVSAAGPFLGVFLLGVLLSTFGANVLASQTVRR